jgi:hypothetical protein
MTTNDFKFQNITNRKKRSRSSSGSSFDSTALYQSFMDAYVKRINESTLRVTYGGVRIGSAKYSRLAQINLKSRIITFSRFAIENVPERGRRYLVIHELAHVKESSHNRKFWAIVAEHEPSYRQVEKELELAFARNVKELRRAEASKLILSPQLKSVQLNSQPTVVEQIKLDLFSDATESEDHFDATEEGSDSWSKYEEVILHGGSEPDMNELEFL